MKVGLISPAVTQAQSPVAASSEIFARKPPAAEQVPDPHSWVADQIMPGKNDGRAAQIASGPVFSPGLNHDFSQVRVRGQAPITKTLPTGSPLSWPVDEKVRSSGGGDGERNSPDRTLPGLGAAPAGASSGHSLPAQIRTSFEKQFLAPFSSVRIHDDSNAAAVARKNQANALTMGEEIHFAKGRYRPFDTVGRRLLAHELTHVLQQRQGAARSTVSDSEAEARDFAERSMTAATLPFVQQAIRASHTGPLFDPSRAKEVLEDEVDDVFCNVKNAWPHLRTANQNERDEIRNDDVLERNIRRRASEMELLKTYLLVAYQTEDLFPAHYKSFIEATDILGTHEARISSILRGVSPTERTEMQNMPGVPEVIEDEMSGDERQTALKLLYGAVEHQGAAAITEERRSTHLERGERYKLDIDATGSFDTVKKNVEDAAEFDGSDVILQDTSLWAKLVDNFDKEETWYLRMIARYEGPDNFPKLTGPNAPEEAIIFPIWDSVKVTGTKEEKLIQTLSAVNNAPAMTTTRKNTSLVSPPIEELKADPWFVPMLEDELSGDDLDRAVRAVSATRTVTVAIREDLRKAINKRNMSRIRELLRDLTLSTADRDALAVDAEILEEMGEDLNGAQLCETSLLLKYGIAMFPADVNGLLRRFQQTPIDVPDVVSYLQSLNVAGGLGALRREPGIYFMLTNSGLSDADQIKVLAAIRADDRRFQEAGSEGTYHTSTEQVRARLPVDFAGSEIRIPIRCNVDLSKMTPPRKFDSDQIEDWIRKIDEVWNNKFELTNDGRTFSLVFSPYIAVGLTPADVTIYAMNWSGRAYVEAVWDSGMGVWVDRTMYLYLEDLDVGTVAHEFGHIFGNPDEYALTAAEHSRITGTPARPQSLRGGESVIGEMGSHSRGSRVEVRHAGPALEVINNARDQTVFRSEFQLQRR